jgi:hypothetical protein
MGIVFLMAGRIAFRAMTVVAGGVVSEGLSWALSIIIIVGLWCLYYLHRIAETLKKILGHLSGVSDDVNAMVHDVQETADAVRKIRNNKSKK